MYTYEAPRCTPMEERLPYNRPDLWGRGSRSRVRVLYIYNIILWASLREAHEAHIIYGVAFRVAADAQERVPKPKFVS